jgi:Mycothiol maleylpyruvate isomerase N-terminal domain
MILLLRTKGAGDFDPEHLLDVFEEQRQRFVTVLQGFGPGDWAAPTRCTDWSAQDVVRHLCDGNMKAPAIGSLACRFVTHGELLQHSCRAHPGLGRLFVAASPAGTREIRRARGSKTAPSGKGGS